MGAEMFQFMRDGKFLNGCFGGTVFNGTSWFFIGSVDLDLGFFFNSDGKWNIVR